MHKGGFNFSNHKVCMAMGKSEVPVFIVQSDVRVHDEEYSRRKGKIYKFLGGKKNGRVCKRQNIKKIPGVHVFEFLPHTPQIMSGRHQFQHSESLYVIHCNLIYSRPCTLNFHGGSCVFHYFLKRDLDDTDLSHIHRPYK